MKFGDINFSTKAMHEYYEYSKRESQHIDTLGSSPKLRPKDTFFCCLLIYSIVLFLFFSVLIIPYP